MTSKYKRMTYRMRSYNSRKFIKIFLHVSCSVHVEVYKEYVEEENRYKFSRSLYGKFLKKLAWAVSIYCVYKMLMSIFNFVIGRKKSMDPVNRILKIILPFFGF